jgi:hypothetical protein
MNTTSNRSGDATDVGRLNAPTNNMAKNILGMNSNFIDKEGIFFLIKLMSDELRADREPAEAISCLLGLAHELTLILEHFECIHFARPRTDGQRQYKETPLIPPKLAQFPSLYALRRLDKVEQRRRLDKRASELLQEIEGLRSGYYMAPDYRADFRMIEQARRKFRKLRDTAMKLGHWTDARWDAGSEETHLV